MVDLAKLIEGAVGELNAVMTDRKTSIGIVDNGHPLADRRVGLVGRFQDENHLVVLQRQRPGEGALLLPGKGVLQIISGMQWPVQIFLIGRHLGKARVVVGHEPRKEGVPFGQGACPGKPQLLDQPVLQGLVRPLDPPLRLARIGADDVDVQCMQCTAKLGHAVTTQRALMVDAENPVLVAVESTGLPQTSR